ncbi:glycosyltransferase family 39 protein [Candidatus Kaiserbacteria bacterium]|nr:glycosyltransferase family 39 protein [Candidatus Kaiserbacteria bacterium]
MVFLRTHLPAIAILALGFALSVVLALLPFDFALTNLLSDDSFYYFDIARNIAQGLGSTADGVNLTNGYHPLWLLAILPLFQLFSTGSAFDIAPVQAILILSTFVNLGIGIVIYRIAGRYTESAWVKASALGLWFFNPFVLYQMLNGLETALSIFFTALLFLAGIRYTESPSNRRLVEAGVVGGLMMLARLDTVFYFLGFLGYLAYHHGLRGSTRAVLISGVAATIVVSPWFLWNTVNFGTVMTSSSVASTMVNHELIVQDHGVSWFQTFKAAVYMTDREARAVAPFIGIPVVLFVLAGLCLGWLFFGRGKASWEKLKHRIPVELFIAAGFVLMFFANATIRWTARPWYFIAINLFIAIWLAWFLEKLRQESYLRSLVAVLISLFSLFLFYVAWSKGLENIAAPQKQMLEATQWMNQNLPEDAVIGAFNSGIQSYFSTHRVVNLDGLVNNEALQALREKNIWQYLSSEGIDYLADYDLYLRYRYKSFLGVDDPFSHLELIYEEPITKLHVYKVYPQ